MLDIEFPTKEESSHRALVERGCALIIEEHKEFIVENLMSLKDTDPPVGIKITAQDGTFFGKDLPFFNLLCSDAELATELLQDFVAKKGYEGITVTLYSNCLSPYPAFLFLQLEKF